MENFKKTLKIAITEQVEGIRFFANEAPTLIQFANERPLLDLGVLGQADVEGIVNSLIPEAASNPGKPTKGELSIVNFGELKLIGCTGGDAKLYVFIPPQGNQLFIQTWNQVSAPPQNDALPPPEENDVSGMFSISSVNENEANPSYSSSQEAPQMQEQPLTEPSGSYDDVEASVTMNAPPPPASVPLARNEGMDNSLESTEDADLTGLGFNSSAVPSTATGTVYSEGLPPVAGMGQTVMASESPIAVQSPITEQNSGAEPSPIVQSTVASPSSHQSHEEIASDTIHFGATLPDEMVDPNKRNPIDEILKVMIQKDASDMHLTQNQPICFRIDGEIHRINDQKIDTATMENLLLPIMPPKNKREFAGCSDTDFAYSVPGLARFRVNIFRDLEGVGAVLRQIPDEVLTADQLGLPEAVRKLCHLSKGLVVVTGPTGSGKSTTLAAMIDLINATRKDHILTIEDPVEFVHKQKMCLINQREVHKHTESFSRALRAALREDPDIILIGEMRDLETVAIAIETAETGHLVFGTLHTNTAISTVDRLVDQFPADQQEQIRVMLAESLKGVVAQTLIKKKGGGRCAAQEILIVDRAVSSLIREGNTHMMGNHMQTQKAKGNILLNEALIQLVMDGKVTVEDAWMKAVDKDAFAQLAQSRGFPLQSAG